MPSLRSQGCSIEKKPVRDDLPPMLPSHAKDVGASAGEIMRQIKYFTHIVIDRVKEIA